MIKILLLSLIFMLSSTLSALGSEQTDSVAAADEESLHTKVNDLLGSAAVEEKTDPFTAKRHLYEAIDLLETPIGQRYIGGQLKVNEQLIRWYENQRAWSEAEELYKHQGSRLWGPGVLSDKLALLFIHEGKFIEARVVLRERIAQETPPAPGGMCGVPSMNYHNKIKMLQLCERKTRDATEAELQQTEKKIRAEFIGYEFVSAARGNRSNDVRFNSVRQVLNF
jgi:hypothetical protein